MSTDNIADGSSTQHKGRVPIFDIDLNGTIQSVLPYYIDDKEGDPPCPHGEWPREKGPYESTHLEQPKLSATQYRMNRHLFHLVLSTMVFLFIVISGALVLFVWGTCVVSHSQTILHLQHQMPSSLSVKDMHDTYNGDHPFNGSSTVP